MNILDVLNEITSETGERVKSKSSDDHEKFADFVEILTGKRNFEGDIDTPAKMQQILDGIKKIKGDLKGPQDSSDKTHAMKKRLAKLAKKADEIQKILDKIKSGDKVTEDEADKYDKFADEVEDILFFETYVKDFTRNETGGSGGKVNKILWENSFPVEYTSDDGTKYYGLVRVPSGVITWQGDKAREVVKNDPEHEIPVKFDIMKPDYKISKNAKVKELEGKLRFKDDDKTKEKVKELYKQHGAEINDRGDIKGLNQALNKVEFWKDIKSLF